MIEAASPGRGFRGLESEKSFWLWLVYSGAGKT